MVGMARRVARRVRIEGDDRCDMFVDVGCRDTNDVGLEGRGVLLGMDAAVYVQGMLCK